MMYGSSPTDDLSDWRYEGVIYRKRQDPEGRERVASVRVNGTARLHIEPGIHALYFCYKGRDAASFIDLTIRS